MSTDFNKIVLDHVAIACEELDTVQSFFESLGIQFDDKRENVDSEKVEVSFGKVDQNSKIELLRPTSKESAIAKFLRSGKKGIHHLSFLVNDLSALQNDLQKKGVVFVYPKAKLGAGNKLVNFIHPKSSFGMLIELSEKIK